MSAGDQVTTFEWVGGPQDGARVSIPGAVAHLEFRPPPRPGPYTGTSVEDVFAQAFPSPIIVELELLSDGRLIARWPGQELGR
jgi:hypothetical protein